MPASGRPACAPRRRSCGAPLDAHSGRDAHRLILPSSSSTKMRHERGGGACHHAPNDRLPRRSRPGVRAEPPRQRPAVVARARRVGGGGRLHFRGGGGRRVPAASRGHVDEVGLVPLPRYRPAWVHAPPLRPAPGAALVRQRRLVPALPGPHRCRPRGGRPACARRAPARLGVRAWHARAPRDRARRRALDVRRRRCARLCRLRPRRHLRLRRLPVIPPFRLRSSPTCCFWRRADRGRLG